jgi:choline dehydrogenase
MNAAAQPDDAGTFDYVIVGAGSAGCVLANRLSADPRTRVALIEAGGNDDWHWIHIPVGLFYMLGNPRTDWCYQSEAEPGIDGRIVPVPRGRMLGGSSSINGMAYIRGQARDYDGWRQSGNIGWGWDDVLPYFRKSEDHIHGADDAHGDGGPLRVEEPRMRPWRVLEAMRDAAEQAGISRRDDFNRGANEGCGYLQLTQRRGRRCSAATAFLKPARGRANLRVLTNARATGLVLDAGRAAGVTFRQGDRARKIRATGEVILSAGAIGSPHLLQLSGMGPNALLARHGIALRRDLPGVGDNLQDHINARFTLRLAHGDTMNTRFHNPVARALMGIEYLLFRRGPMTLGAILTGFARSDPSRETANLQFHATTASYDELGGDPHRFPALAGGVCNLRPRSRGHVRLRDADPFVHPELLHNFLVDSDDQRVAIDSIRLMRRIFAEPALAPYAPEEYLPSPACQSDEELLANIRETSCTAYHPVGTCKMGSDPMAVVDHRLRVIGVDALRVADASIMPTLISGNTNAPAIMIGEKASDMILQDARDRA